MTGRPISIHQAVERQHRLRRCRRRRSDCLLQGNPRGAQCLYESRRTLAFGAKFVEIEATPSARVDRSITPHAPGR